MSGRSLLVGLSVALAAAAAAAQTPAEQREKLRKQLGLPQVPTAPAPTEPTPEDPVPADDPPPGALPTPPDTPPTTPSAPPAVTYIGSVHALVTKHCASCHGPSGMAGATGYRLSGDRATDHRATLAQVRRSSPAASPLLREAAGEGHGGGVVLSRQSAGYRTLRRWIDDGALLQAESTPPAPPASTPLTTATTPPAASSRPPRTANLATVRPTDRDVALVEVGESWTPGTTGLPVTPAAVPVGEPYAPAIHDLLVQRCAGCHGPEGGARGTRYVHRGEPASDYPVVRALVDPQRPADSLLVRKATGDRHVAVLVADGAEHRALVRWIEQGALAEAPAAPTPAPAPDALPVDAVTAATPAPTSTRLGEGTPLPTTKKSPLPFSLPFNLQINGKIDFSYERRDYRDHPFQKAGRNAFATYHHFIYLSRSGAKDPFGFNIELVTRQFYEVNARFSAGRRFRAIIKAGKLLVPFGGEPLYHHSYGGRSGFDQEILPVVWARPGLGAQFQVRLPRGVTIANDIYLIAGHALPAAGGVLNLQGDLSTLDEVKPAFGDRLGLSWGPLTGWYSLYVSPLGSGRTLVMQAVDLELWRPGKIPFIRDLVPSMGLMRADVSGGARGEDYYHFGSYWSLSYTPIQYLSLQYRNGLRTHDNRRGVFFDPTRADASDRGSHNLSIYGRYKGAYVGLQLFWNLEKAGERDDDFLRMTVGYAF